MRINQVLGLEMSKMTVKLVTSQASFLMAARK